MTKFLTIALLTTVLAVGTNTAAAGVPLGIPYPPRPTPSPHPQPPKPHHSEGRWRGPCSDWWVGENLTPEIWNTNPDRGIRMMQRLVVCIFGTYAPGESLTALYVVDRESGFYPWAQNPSSGAAGLMQHITWTGRAAYFLKKWMFRPGYHPSAFDPRANLIVGAKMVASGGWGPWAM